MKNALSGGAMALLATFCSHVVYAQEVTEITVESQTLKPASGLMNDHMHEGGEAMVGLRFTRSSYGGANRSGTQVISDVDIHAAGFSTRARKMTMDMVMLDLMFGITEDITVMVMPHYMWHRMEMVGIDPTVGMGEMGGGEGGGHMGGHTGAVPFGQSHNHSAEGLGDTLVSASYRLARSRRLNVHATLGLWLPTGSVGKMNADGSFVHYGMQPGSGTWDVEPSVTLSGHRGAYGWGAQASYRWRTDNTNASGFAFGDKARASAWVSYLLGSDVGASARLEYTHEGPIEEHYNGAHNHHAPPDRQANYGGDIVSAGLGLNWLLPIGGANRPQLGVDASLPLYQDLNGIQLPRDWSMSLSISRAF